jgi:hypothetical protein
MDGTRRKLRSAASAGSAARSRARASIDHDEPAHPKLIRR